MRQITIVINNSINLIPTYRNNTRITPKRKVIDIELNWLFVTIKIY